MTDQERGDTGVAGLRELAEVARLTADTLEGEIGELVQMVVQVIRGGGRLLFCGNGGSAADAQHLAAEYVVRFHSERRGLPAMALTTDTSILTAAANDYGFQEIFARQVQALGRPGDLLILHSTSGESGNLLRAAETARACGLKTAALLARNPAPTDQDIDRAMNGNICRCGTYLRIRKAIHQAAAYATDGASGGSDTENGEGA